MTSEKALSNIKHIDIDGRYPYPNFLKDDVRYKESIEFIEKRLNELEKRDTPKKPIVNIINGIREYNCGVCVCMLDIPQLREVNFCPKCGQRLDW